jgi:hypothetical protein
VASIATYGAYTSGSDEINLVNFSTTKNYARTGKKLTETRRVTLQGELNYDTPAALIAAANNVIAGFSQNYHDFNYTVGGSTAHSLTNTSECISGVRVVRTSFPKGDPAELCTTRTFTVDLEAIYDACDDDIIESGETLELVGTGGPLLRVVNTFYGPYLHLVSLYSPQYITQSGWSVGYRGYPAPPGPVLPAGEFYDRRRIQDIKGRQMGNGYRFFTKKWTYYMVANVPGFII